MFTLIVVLLVHSTDLALFPLKKIKKAKKRIKRPGPSGPNSSNAILLRLFSWNN